jgi:eukaryotic-like serine/threonine-protein kinase
MRKCVFISHASTDFSSARRIYEALESRGLSCWIAPRDIPLGETYGAAIMEGVRETDVFLILVSDAAGKSKQVEREVERAAHYNRPIVPVIITKNEPTDRLEYYLAGRQWLDCSAGVDEPSLELLAQSIHNILWSNRRESGPDEETAVVSNQQQRVAPPAPVGLNAPASPGAAAAVGTPKNAPTPAVSAPIAPAPKPPETDPQTLVPPPTVSKRPGPHLAGRVRTTLSYGKKYKRGVAALAVAAVITVAALVAFPAWPGESSVTSTGARTLSLAILPFRNASDDQSLGWLGPALAEMLRNELGQSALLRSVTSDRLEQILRDLRISPDSSLDPTTVRRLAQLAESDVLVWGRFLKFGREIRIEATVDDVRQGRTTPVVLKAPGEPELLATIGELAGFVRESLAFTPDIVKELQAKSARPSSESLPAIRAYNEGMQLARQGRSSEALKQFQAATEADPAFALAYSRLARVYASLGYGDDAEQSSQKAVELSEGLPAGEKYLIAASHARVLNDTTKAVESYENLLKAAPDDAQTQFDLAGLYEDTGALDQSKALYSKLIASDANNMSALYGLGRIEIRRRNPQGALDHLHRALSLAIQVDSVEPKANILHAVGIAYKRLDKPADALRYYTESLEMRRQLGQKGGVANTLNEIAQVDITLGRPDEALKSYQEALQLRREIGDTRGIGNNLLDLGVFYSTRGQYTEALALYKESLQIWRRVGNQNYEALTLNNIGNAYLFTGQYGDALTYFERALQLREKAGVASETALVLYNLATTSARLGRYDQALAHDLRALELWRTAGDKRQAAIAAYSMAEVFEYQGRYKAALQSTGEALATLRELGERSGLDGVMSRYGSALSQAGRLDEAAKALDEALKLARELQHQGIVAQTLNYQGINEFFRGESAAARRLFDEALKIATTINDRHLAFVSRGGIAKLDVREQRAEVAALRSLAEEADIAGLQFVATECAIAAGEVLLGQRNYQAAEQELLRSLSRAERLGATMLAARTHHLIAQAQRGAGREADAGRQAERARRLLQDASKELGDINLLHRADLKDIR